MRRREFLKQMAFGSVALTPLGASDESSVFPKLNTYQISLPSLPRSFRGYRIGFISDIHLGVWLPNEALEHGVNLLNNAGIDLLLIGGDLPGIPDSFPGSFFPVIRNPEFEGKPRHELPQPIYHRAADLLSRASAKDGIHAVFGNHDRWVEPWICVRELKARGISLLINEAKEIRRGTDRFTVYGADDYWTGVPRMQAIRETTPTVLLCHNPDFASKLLATSATPPFQLALCGHTHGGQIRLPVMGAMMYNIEDPTYGAGLVRDPVAGSQVFTSTGMGFVEVPYRLNCPSEVVIFELT